VARFSIVILWMLSPDTKLYKLYEYYRDRVASKVDKESGLIPAAVYPGSLVEPLNGIISLGTIYHHLLSITEIGLCYTRNCN